MIYKGNRNIGGVFTKNKAVSAVYKGGRLVWTGIRSCFGSGVWIDEKPWIDEDRWKDHR